MCIQLAETIKNDFLVFFRKAVFLVSQICTYRYQVFNQVANEKFIRKID